MTEATTTSALTMVSAHMGYVLIPVVEAPENPAEIAPHEGATYQDVEDLKTQGWREEYELMTDEGVYIWMSR